MLRSLTIGLTAAPVLAACSPSASPSPAAALTPATAVAEVPAIVPLLVSSELASGPNRFLFSPTAAAVRGKFEGAFDPVELREAIDLP